MATQQQNGQAIESLRIGDKLKNLREKGRFTLKDLTAKTGLPMDLLSQIENDEVVPPVATLLKLANALNVGMAYFFQEKAGVKKVAVTREDERIIVERRPHHHKGEVNYIYEALEAKKANKHMEPFLVKFPSQELSDMVFVSHEGEEFLHVIEGRLEFRTVDQVEILEPGDSIYFESDIGHSFRCLGKQTVKAFVVVWNKRQP